MVIDPPTTSRGATPPLARASGWASWSRRRGVRWVVGVIALWYGSHALLQPFAVPTSSMEPAILAGDYVLVNRLAYRGGHGPQRGDIIAFAPPFDPSARFVKRVVAVAGDTVGMTAGHLYRNGRGIAEPYVRSARAPDVVESAMTWQRAHRLSSGPTRAYRPSRDTWGPLVVPRGALMALGDNRGESADSRYWGFVEVRAVTGRLAWVAWSATETPAGWRIRWSRVGTRIR
jgi:signal peptidase I